MITSIDTNMYSQLPEKTITAITTELLATEPENKPTNIIIQDIFTNLCKNNCHYECIKLLIDSGKVDVAIDGNYAIKYASYNGHSEVVKLLLSTGKVDVAIDDNYVIKFASQNGHLEVVKLLLSTDKVDVIGNNYAIRYASYNGHLEIVKLLLSTGKVDVTAKDNYTIKYASHNGHLEIVKLLLSTDKVDVTAQDNYAIKYASRNGHLEIVKLLLSTDKVDITAEDNFAIKCASYYGHLEVVKFLLSTGKIDIKNISDSKILHLSSQIKSENESINVETMIQLMKENGISKIVIGGEKNQLTTDGSMNTKCEPSEIIRLMVKYNITKCKFDKLLSKFGYKVSVDIINTSKNIE